MPRSIVPFDILPPLDAPDSVETIRLYGVIVALESHFAYVLADPRFFYDLRDRGIEFRLLFHFPGHPPILNNAPDTHIGNLVIGMCCPYPQGYDLTLIEELKLSEEPPPQDVYVYSPGTEVITSGSVISMLDGGFQINCSFDNDTEDAAPVLNSARHLLGLCISVAGLYLDVLSADFIARDIELSQKRVFQSIETTLQHLRSLNAP